MDEPSLFKGANKLTRISISGNLPKFTKIVTNFFEGMQHKIGVEIRNQKHLTTIEANAFNGLVAQAL